MDVERNFDYVVVTDANGTEVARYTGTFRRGVTTPCINTNVSNVQLLTDGSVVGQGFVVDAAVPCSGRPKGAGALRWPPSLPANRRPEHRPPPTRLHETTRCRRWR